MKTTFSKLILASATFLVLTLSACSHDNGRNDTGNKDNDNRGNHATDPAVPPDAEYPGSKLNDSVYKSDSTRHH